MHDSAQIPHASGEVDFFTPDEVAERMRLSAHFVRKHYLRFGGYKVAGMVRIPANYLTHLRAADEAALTDQQRTAS